MTLFAWRRGRNWLAAEHNAVISNQPADNQLAINVTELDRTGRGVNLLAFLCRFRIVVSDFFQEAVLDGPKLDVDQLGIGALEVAEDGHAVFLAVAKIVSRRDEHNAKPG